MFVSKKIGGNKSCYLDQKVLKFIADIKSVGCAVVIFRCLQRTIFLDKSCTFGIIGKFQDLKKYRCSFAKSVLTLKKLRGQKPINFSTGFDLCAQQLLVLITGSKIKPFSDSNSYGFRLFKSAYNALG